MAPSIIDADSVQRFVRSQRARKGACVPSAFCFYNTTGEHGAPSDGLLFLGAERGDLSDTGKPVSTLYSVPLPHHLPADESDENARPKTTSSCPYRELKWTPLLVPEVIASETCSNESSPEDAREAKSGCTRQALRREHIRPAQIEVSSYEMFAQDQKLILALGGVPHLLSFGSSQTPAEAEKGAESKQVPKPRPRVSLRSLVKDTVWSEINSPRAEQRLRSRRTFLNLEFSPDGRLISFVRDSDLWVLDVESGAERRLTYSAEDIDTDQSLPASCSMQGRAAETPFTDSGRGVSGLRSAKQMTRLEHRAYLERLAAQGVGKEYRVSGELRQRTCGLADHVTQEEFGRHIGAWWCPERDPVSGHYQLLYLQVDYSSCPTVSLPTYDFDGSQNRHFYPKPGQANCTSEPAIVSVPPAPPASDPRALFEWSEADPRDVAETLSWAPQTPLSLQFPWIEYIPRAGWLPSRAHPGSDNTLSNETEAAHAEGRSAEPCFWLQIMDRVQERTEFVVFSGPQGNGHGVPVVCQVNKDYWVNVLDGAYFLKNQKGFIFCSEQTGFSKLYHTSTAAAEEAIASGTVDLDPVAARAHLSIPADTAEHSDDSDTEPATGLRAGERRRVPAARLLTPSDATIVESIVHVDEYRELVYYSCTVGDPRERHLCVSSYAADIKTGAVQCLTKPGFTHSDFHFDDTGERVVLNLSSVTVPTLSKVFKVEGLVPRRHASDSRMVQESLATIKLVCIAELENPRQDVDPCLNTALVAPELFDFEADDGTKIYGAVYHPTLKSTTGKAQTTNHAHIDGRSPPEAYRTVLMVYGGPCIQVVRNEWALTSDLRCQQLSTSGIAVVKIDGRGSSRRGLAFEGIFRKYGFGEIEIRDQVRGLEHLISRGIVDANRIACFGWSYGAYAACMLKAKYGSMFKKAICGSTVVDWEAYDTAYTERYLKLPERNKDLYESSSLLNQVDAFSDTEDELMLIASLRDDNVHCNHTIALVHKMMKLNKPHKLLLFPKERHGLYHPAAVLHFETSFFRFISSL